MNRDNTFKKFAVSVSGYRYSWIKIDYKVNHDKLIIKVQARLMGV